MRACTVSKTFRFEAAHQLPNHKGKCRNLHGHSYVLEVGVLGAIHPEDQQSTDGMVLDFSDLGAVVKSTIIDQLDHKFLNDVLPKEFHPTTAENIAWWIYSRLNETGLFDPQVGLGGETYRLEYIKVWETATSCAIVTRENILSTERCAAASERAKKSPFLDASQDS